jgi:glycosyltransferase involved in cell wall biosynthesis
MKKALLIAFHFPPFSGSSGVQRTLKFTKYLPEFGWEPIVLSADPRAYPSRSSDLLREIPQGTVVHRAFALDAGRQLAVRGRYLGLTALPDRWVSWWPAAVWSGLRLIRRYRPEVIWATYPIATTHLIGASLARLAGLPLVADYRDAMVVDDFPEDPAVRRLYSRIERRVTERCRAAVVTTPRSCELYRARYPDHAGKFVCIRNGYDDADFDAIPAPVARAPARRLRLLHSGLLKLTERDPRPFLGALKDLLATGALAAGDVEVVFRAPGDEAAHRRLIGELGLGDVVRVEPAIAYDAALSEMTRADVLLLFQDANCNHLVPAKLYEYIRARRPVLALTDHAGESADLVREAAAGLVLDIASRESIRTALPGFLRDVRRGDAPSASADRALRYSRRRQTGELAELLAHITGSAT